MSNVVQLNCATSLDIPPDKILDGAAGKLDQVLVIGEYEKDGDMYDYHACSTADKGKILLMIERFKLKLLTEY